MASKVFNELNNYWIPIFVGEFSILTLVRIYESIQKPIEEDHNHDYYNGNKISGNDNLAYLAFDAKTLFSWTIRIAYRPYNLHINREK